MAKQLHAILPPQTIHRNVHGASECCTGIHYRVPRANSDQIENNTNQETLVPAGRAVCDITAYIVDENLQLITEKGQVGEILYKGE